MRPEDSPHANTFMGSLWCRRCHVMHLRGRPCECSSCTRPRWLSLSGHQLIQPCQIHSVEAADVRISHSDCSLRMITCNRLQLSTSASGVDRQQLTVSATRPPQNKMISLTFLQAVSRITSWSVCMRRVGGGTKRVSLVLSNPRDRCQGTASHWRDAQPTTVFAAKCVPTSVRRSSLWTVMPCRTHVPHLYRHVVNVSPSIDILHHS